MTNVDHNRVYAVQDEVDLTRWSIESLCKTNDLHCIRRDSTTVFDWSAPTFLSITQIVGLTQAVAIAKGCGCNSKLVEPNCTDARNYISRMNAFRLMDEAREESFRRLNPGTRFIPMERIDSTDKPGEVADRIGDMLKAHIGSSERTPSGAINLSFSEIMDNILTHSESPTFGVAAAQYYPTKRLIELCVADGGRGIVSTMGTNPNYAFLAPNELMRYALETGYGQYVGHDIYKDERTSGGMGLTYATRLTQALKGKMWIVSHEYALEVSESGISEMEGLYYPGTIISLRLPVDANSVVLGSQLFPGAINYPANWNNQEGWFTVDDSGDTSSLLW